MKIAYLTNFIDDEVYSIRNNKNIMAQPANNKILLMREAMNQHNIDVKILSSGLTNNKSGKFYKKHTGEKNNILFMPIIDLPLLNIISSILFTILELIKLKKRKELDYIIFWNYKPEVAIPSIFARLFLRTPIIVDYEDGYFALKSISNKKRLYFNITEKFTNIFLNGAILVSSQLINRIPKGLPSIMINGIINTKVSKIIQSIKTKKINNVPVIMYSGGLDEERGIDILLNSLKYTKLNFKLYVSGKGSKENFVINYPDKRVEFLGYLPYEELVEYLYNSDILVNPQKINNSFGSASFPSKIFDYLPTNNWIISSNIDKAEDIFGNSLSFFYDDSPQDLARAIDQTISKINSENKESKKLNKKFSVHHVGLEVKNLLKRTVL